MAQIRKKEDIFAEQKFHVFLSILLSAKLRLIPVILLERKIKRKSWKDPKAIRKTDGRKVESDDKPPADLCRFLWSMTGVTRRWTLGALNFCFLPYTTYLH